MKRQWEIPLCRYQYDALNRMIDLSLSGQLRLQRFYCKNRLSTEIEGTIKYSVVQHDDWLLAQQRVDGSVLNIALLATDKQRSVLQVQGEAPRQPFAYTPFGHRPHDHGLLNLLGFNGEWLGRVTGHYLLGNGYRAFNPVLMRFNSPDSLSPFKAGGLNSYTYCLGDPINSSDPTGHISVPLTPRLLAPVQGGNLTGRRGLGVTEPLNPVIGTHTPRPPRSPGLETPRPPRNPSTSSEPTISSATQSTTHTAQNLAESNLITEPHQPGSLVAMSLSVVVSNRDRLDLSRLPGKTLKQIDNESRRINSSRANTPGEAESTAMWIGLLGELVAIGNSIRQFRRPL